MDFGIHIGTRGCLTSRENVMAVAQRAEALGYAYLGVSDHLIVPVQSDSALSHTPRMAAGRRADTGDCFDCIATLAFLAGCTQRIKLLTSVVVVPYRPAVLTAKLFMTADVLSGGRVIAGVGVGWMPEEFAALGTPAIRRARRGDRRISGGLAFAVDRREAEARRQVCQLRRCAVLAKTGIKAAAADLGRRRKCPCVAPHGEVRRRLVSGVEQPGYPPQHAGAPAEGHRKTASRGGARRPGSFIDRCRLSVVCPAMWTTERSPEPRQLFSGSSDDMLADAAALETAGARHAIFYVQRPTIEETLDVIQRFGEEVVRKA